MSDFITRLVDRTMGSCGVVQPLITSVYAGELIVNDKFPSSPIPVEITAARNNKRVPYEPGEADVSLSGAKVAPVNTGTHKENKADRYGEPDMITDRLPDRENGNHLKRDKLPDPAPRLVPDNEAAEDRPFQQLDQQDHNMSNTHRIVERAYPEQSGKSETGIWSNGPADKYSGIHNEENRPTLFSDTSAPGNDIRHTGITSHEVDQELLGPPVQPAGTDNMTVTVETEPGRHPEKRGMDFPPRTVQVTIGRIDVRAVMQQAPRPERIASAEPKLSLDNYLKQRSGGR